MKQSVLEESGRKFLAFPGENGSFAIKHSTQDHKSDFPEVSKQYQRPLRTHCSFHEKRCLGECSLSVDCRTCCYPD